MKTTIDMAREAGFDVVVQINAVDGSIAHLTAFAALVRADEREACAKEADKWSRRDDDVGAFIGKSIRARGNT
jgi:hypothetical protein